MIIQTLAVIITVLLIFTNGLTDAPNAIATIIGSKVMSFRKASIISAIFNFIGIAAMSFVNISVADCISTMVNVHGGLNGILVLITAMLSVIIFALVAMRFGIPTSETHGLVAGLTGSAIAVYGIGSVNGAQWLSVGIGLIWSIFGTFVVAFIVEKMLKRALRKVEDTVVSKFQIISMCAMSFMHGAQDGQKFIGILIIYTFIVKGLKVPEYIVPTDFAFVIMFVAFVMFVGVAIGGEKIAENVGNNVTQLSKKQALSSDIASSITLFLASLNGLPVSTSHVKTMAILGVGKSDKQTVGKKAVIGIIKAWILTFPVCLILSYILAKIFIRF
ncbi:MAG: inorganic phosphate transporter [Clostridia bacterium]|nr:inorganic phosphate transporter [Clostridia bacterium]